MSRLLPERPSKTSKKPSMSSMVIEIISAGREAPVHREE
jgi:hypothetical protein